MGRGERTDDQCLLQPHLDTFQKHACYVLDGGGLLLRINGPGERKAFQNIPTATYQREIRKRSS